MNRLIFAILIGIATTSLGASSTVYEPTRESLSNYEVPEWYRDAKIGFFYHWGPGSVPGLHFNKDEVDFCQQNGKYKDSGLAKKNPVGQWGANMYPRPGKPDHEQNSNYFLHKKFFGDPKEFGYKELISLLTGENFDPEEMVQLLDEAGVKYIVPMAVHHDGFAMWDSKVIDQYNAAKMGPKKNTTKLVVDAARARGIKVGVSTHVARHSWYYPKTPGYDVSDPQYVQLYGEGLGKGGIPKPAAVRKWEDTLAELVEFFHPDYIFVDGGTADTFCMKGSYVVNDAFRRVVANYYNRSREFGVEPVITFKRESLYKEEAVPDYEAGYLFDKAPYVWQTHANTCGWFYRPGQWVVPSHVNFRKIIDTVSKNGNMLLNLAIAPDGSIQEAEIQFLKDMAEWTGTLGEGIYASRPWRVYGELGSGSRLDAKENTHKGKVYKDPEAIPAGRMNLNENDIRYTRSKDEKTIYATILAWPKMDFTLTSFAEGGIGEDVEVGNVSLLGRDEKIDWKRTAKGIAIQVPSVPVFKDQNWPVMFKIDVK
ncbi:alpha-L-fucosidase [Pontiella sulfatireligans]|uniref:alpha-L-fucosidase n=1 Tax=Pontiella sulfatireligans TaxID=2750658 RepID=A0A6C2UNY6_9BACT|nr:alpha-L-fucosidase [Pontiella sulfatireligans]VGO21898.1 hypothetical protein SCARR_03978 [Pontiella sulfatireligans]